MVNAGGHHTRHVTRTTTPHMTQILTGDSLQKALNATQGQIPLFVGKLRVRDLGADEVPLLIGDSRYEFVGRKARVRYVRQLDPNAVIKTPWRATWRACWLNTEAAVMRFHGEAA